MKKVLKKKSFNFSLENNYYKNLNFILYFIVAFMILFIYMLATIIYSKHNIYLTFVIYSIFIIYVYINKNKLIKTISDLIQYWKKKQFNINNPSNSSRNTIKRTFKKISHKNKNLQLNIKNRVTIKEKIKNIQNKFKKTNNKELHKERYIKIED